LTDIQAIKHSENIEISKVKGKIRFLEKDSKIVVFANKIRFIEANPKNNR
jgi:hypothetical protein